MSRRRVSVRDLGQVDCQGWLQRRKEGRSFLGSKWKRYWFVLKKTFLYWYINRTADKAEGFINLCGFTIQQAKQSRRKHAMTATHPQVVTIFIAADSVSDMNEWINKLSKAAESCDVINVDECYSEDSDHGDCCDSTQQEMCPCESPPCTETSSSTITSEHSRGDGSVGGALNRNRGRAFSEGHKHLSWLDLHRPAVQRSDVSRLDSDSEAVSLPLIHIGETTENEGKEMPHDEMESLYVHLKASSLSLVGQSSQRDFRTSFIRRCKNDKLNEKVHLLRILSSTLKAKELELKATEQILTNPALSPPTYRKWKLTNLILLQEISQHSQAAGGIAELTPPEQLSGK